MALETELVEFPFAQGQDEGTERAVLPVGRFSYLQNTRFRKHQRIGKRNGYTSKTSLDASGAALGNGSGRLSCLGPHFCVVDDRFYRRSPTLDAWQLPPQPFEGGPFGGTRLPGRFPQFLPGPALETLTVQSDTNLGGYGGTSGDSIGGICYGLGLVWTACGYYSEAGASTGSWLVRVTAIDPATGDSVFQDDVVPEFSVAAGERFHPVLLATGNGNTIMLAYERYTAGVKTAVCVRVLTSVVTGFGTESVFTCLQSAFAADPFTPNGVLFVYTLTGTPAEVTVARVNPATMAATASATYTLGGNKTLLSCFGNALGQVWIGFTDAADGLRIRAYDSTLTATGTSPVGQWVATVTNAVGPFYFAARTTTTAVAVTNKSGAVEGIGAFDVSAAAALSGGMQQFNALAVSQPFACDSQVFIWVRHTADAQLGVASLLRIPRNSDYLNGSIAPNSRAWPLEATVDDRDVDEPVATDLSGPVVPTPVSTPMGYVALINHTRETIVADATTTLLRGFVVVPVRHRSEGVRYATSGVVPCTDKLFVPAAQPMWVDRLTAYEGGFVQAPVVTRSDSGTGDLTASSTYSYTAVFYSLDANGNLERSAPAVPVEFETTAGGTEQNVVITGMGFGARTVRAELYRTLANGSVFKLINSVDVSPALVNGATVTFVDGYPDSELEQNKTLYTQIGQELPTSQFPACSFANVGGGRLWCAGGFHGNVAHASKVFMPRIAPEFADDDAFRVSLPANITGSAWCDNQVFFTQEGIYVVSGDGPDGAGVGSFTTSRLPFNVGCIDWRSVVVTDLGVFFQSPRGLYLLPRGFGQPVAMDQVLDTLSTYPIITSARADYDSRGGADNSEQVVQWTAVADEAATSGVVITFDAAYQAFSVDTYAADFPVTFQAGWSGDAVHAPAVMTVGAGGAGSWHPFRVRDDGYDDNGLTIAMRAVTGDVRPWGMFAHGVVNRIGLLGQLRSACTVNTEKVTDRGTAHTAPRVYTAAGTPGQPAAGSDIYLEVPLGGAEHRDITSVRVAVAETSAVEGVALFGMVIERDRKPQGFRLQGPADRVQ